MLLDIIGFGIIIPVIPEFIMELTGEGLSQAAVYGGWLLMLYALMQFFCAPILGNLSDRFGRRPVLLFSLMAFSADYFIMGLAPNITWLFFGRIMAGIAGATFTSANALHRRCESAGKTGAEFWLDRRGFWARLYYRAGCRRFARADWPPGTFLYGRGPGTFEPGLWVLRFAGSAERG